jgi:hypothetical protein
VGNFLKLLKSLPEPVFNKAWLAFGLFLASCFAFLTIVFLAMAQLIAPEIMHFADILASIPDTIALIFLTSAISVGIYYAFRD